MQMTNQEAIDVLKNDIEICTIQQEQACDMAIKALKQQPCEDCISREEFERRIKPYDTENKTDKALYNFAHNILIGCPSVTPQPKKGKWIEVIDELDSFGNKTWHYECSICKNKNSGWGDYKYCPNCGADMMEINVDKEGSDSE